MIGSGFSSLPYSQASLPAVHYDPRAAVLGMDDVGTVGVGKGGQIFRIKLAGIAGDAIANQRIDSHWVDAVIQTPATWTAVANPDSGLDFHYHPAGCYSRGPLSSRRQYDSPILRKRLDLAGGVYETLNLAQQAHVEHDGYAPDQFLIRTIYRRVGKYVIEVESSWMNYSMTAMPGKGPGTTPLDYFNFPWAVMDQDTLKTAYLELGNGERKDVTALSWQTDNQKYMDRGINWFGLFSSPVGDGVAIVPPQGATVKLGTVIKSGIVENGRTGAPWMVANQKQYVFGARHFSYLGHGQMLTARWYLLVGVRPDQAKAQAETRRPQALIEQVAAPPQPTYEILDHGVTVHSTDPYNGRRDRSYLTDSQYVIKGIV